MSKEISKKPLEDNFENKYFNPDKRIEFLSSYKDRIDQVPKQGWEGIIGESKCKTNNEEVNRELAKYGLDGVDYKNAIPDEGFKKCSEAVVSIKDFSSNRKRNFNQAYNECAKKWNQENKYGKSDWTGRKVEDYKKDNNLVWHECSNRKECCLIKEAIHEAFSHSGGHKECKIYDELKYGKKGESFYE